MPDTKLSFSQVPVRGYSEDEQRTGETWIDEKPIYKKTLTATIAAADASTYIDTVLLTGPQGRSLALDDVIRSEGFWETNGSVIALSSAEATGAYSFLLFRRGANFNDEQRSSVSLKTMSPQARNGNDRCVVTIYYTKTTD
jgi:hypothetical protein